MEKNQTFRNILILAFAILIALGIYFFTQGEEPYENIIDEKLAQSFIDNYNNNLSSCLRSESDIVNIESLAEWLADSNFKNNDLFVMHYTKNNTSNIHLNFAIYDDISNDIKSEIRDFNENGYSIVSEEQLDSNKLIFNTNIENCAKIKLYSKYAFYTVEDMRNYLVYISNKADSAIYIEFKFSQIDSISIANHTDQNVVNRFSQLYQNQNAYLLPICYVLDASKIRIMDVQAKDCASLCPTQCHIF